MSKIDLHMHSSYSDDGELSPAEIIEVCKGQGMKWIAITDHNTVRGVPEALSAAGDDLGLVSGVELDCTYGGKNFHLLGYGFDYTRREFLEIEQDILRQERAAAAEKIRLFREYSGIPISIIEVLAKAGDQVVTGELIAEMLFAQKNAAQYELLHPYLPGGAKSDMPNVSFYWDFFAEGKPAYVPIHYITLTDAIALIHSAGGIAVLAHPGQNFAGEETRIPAIIAEKIDGIEVFSSYHTKESAEYYMGIAMGSQLILTCGSDFHGKHKPKIKPGGHGSLWSDEELMRQFVTIHSCAVHGNIMHTKCGKTSFEK